MPQGCARVPAPRQHLPVAVDRQRVPAAAHLERGAMHTSHSGPVLRRTPTLVMHYWLLDSAPILVHDASGPFA